MALIDKVKGTPVNKTAALITSQSKQTFDDTKHLDPRMIHSDTPLPVKEYPKNNPHPDLTGRRCGWLTVVGLLDREKVYSFPRRASKRGAPWVVRCVCGAYETRRRKALMNPKNRVDRCHVCQKIATMKRHMDYLVGKPQKEQWEY